MITKGKLNWNDSQSVIILAGLPDGTAAYIYDKEISEQESKQRFSDFMEHKTSEYEGPLSMGQVVDAIKKGCSAVYIDDFLIESRRKQFFKAIKNVNCQKVILFDAIPYDVCRPSNYKEWENYENYMHTLSLPRKTEGHDYVKINAMPHSSLSDYYSCEHYINRNHYAFMSDELCAEALPYRILLEIEYVRKQEDVFQRALTLMAAFYLESGKFSVIVGADDKAPFDGFAAVSALDFFAYASEFLEEFHNASYKDSDIYDMAQAIALHSDERIEILTNLRDQYEIETHNKELGEIYRLKYSEITDEYDDSIVEAAILLYKASKYANANVKYLKKSCDGEDVLRRLTEEKDYIIETLNGESMHSGSLGSLQFEV